MNTNSTQREILLMTGTSYLSKEWCGKDESKSQLSSKEMLEEACWNGLLKDIIPELFRKEEESNLYLWQIKSGSSFLELEFGEYPDEKDKYFSIDPYSFLGLQSEN